MASIKDVTLAFSGFDNTLDTNEIMVQFTTVFSTDEAGKQFRVKIELYERQHARTGRFVTPFLTFKYGWFGRSDYYLITAIDGETVHAPSAYPVNEAVLNTNPVVLSTNEDTPEFFSAVVSLTPDYAPVWGESPTAEHVVPRFVR